MSKSDKTIQIHEILNGQDSSYLEYAKYVVNDRAIPYLTDGFKPTQRKIIHVSLKHAKNKMKNVSALAGYVKAESGYHHSDSSLPDQIINLAQPFKVSMPYYLQGGQFGDVYEPSAAAPRYLEVMLSSAFKLLFMDNDLVDKKYDEGNEIEPVTYFPILPTVLLNPIAGIALGYSFNSTPRSPIDLLDTIVSILIGDGNIDVDKPIAPYVDGLQGKWVWHSGNQKWEHHGFMEVKNSTTVVITGLPYGTTYDSYEWHLNQLCEQGYMVDFANRSVGGRINYELKFTREQLSRHVSEDTLYHKLKMYSRLDKDILTVIDINDKPRRFDNDIELCDRFVEYRLGIYTERKRIQLEKLREELDYNNEVIRFIKLVNTGEIKVDQIKSKQSLIELLTNTHKFVYSDKLAEIRIYRLTIEEIDKLLNKIEEIKKQIEYYETSTETDLYLEDLTSLRKELTEMGYSHQEYEIW